VKSSPHPGSTSTVYEPNPAAIVVAIDRPRRLPGLGRPRPSKARIDFSEKTMTLAIGLELRRLLEAQGITVVMTRRADEALAGDDYPDLGCHGAPFRDVTGDGEIGFDPSRPAPRRIAEPA
jgi:N-acetylmuramoyl-L-alanine amidase